MKRVAVIFIIVAVWLSPLLASAVQVAPRITDKEIVERLTRLEEGQKAINKRIDGLERSLNKRIDDLRVEMNDRFNTLQWMLGLFITISLVILGFVLRMQWQMQKRQTSLEAMLRAHEKELAFLKNLIEKLLPPKGVL
ncbi:MAG: hemolysin XhlA family protein [Candidatus Desulfofervidaceae bacterium]|nr:hemolysin XhlA family protein [Candidatus Desulfofervidaceae bacterium]